MRTSRSRLPFILVAAAAGLSDLAFPSLARAAFGSPWTEQACGDLYVTRTDDRAFLCRPGDCTLREATIRANSCSGHDTIHLPAGGYRLTLTGSGDSQTHGDLDISDTVTIVGDGYETTSIGARDLGDRVIEIWNTNGVVNISGITLGGGGGDDYYEVGGCIRVHSGGYLVLDNSEAVSCTTKVDGGAIFAENASVTLSSSRFIYNSAGIAGGAVYADETRLKVLSSILVANDAPLGSAIRAGYDSISRGEDLYVADSSFRHNDTLTNSIFGTAVEWARDDGGLLISGGRALIERTYFGDNLSLGGGAAIFVAEDSLVTVDEGNFASNIGGYGAAIRSFGNLTIRHSDFAVNQATEDGGAVEAWNAVFVEDTTFDGNRAIERGGALVVRKANAGIDSSSFFDNSATRGGAAWLDDGIAITNSTLSGNRASEDGGALFISDGTTYLKNCTVAFNQARRGGGLYARWDSAAAAFGYAFANHTILANNNAEQCVDERYLSSTVQSIRSIGYNLQGDRSCGLNKVGDFVAADALLAPRGANGGWTDTHKPYPTSPVINAGSTATTSSVSDLGCLPEDQRGVVRPLSGGIVGGARCDIGAVEYEGRVRLPDLPAL